MQFVGDPRQGGICSPSRCPWEGPCSVRVDGVVVALGPSPRHRNSRLEPIGVGHRIEGHRASIGPAPDCDPILIELRVLRQQLAQPANWSFSSTPPN